MDRNSPAMVAQFNQMPRAYPHYMPQPQPPPHLQQQYMQQQQQQHHMSQPPSRPLSRQLDPFLKTAIAPNEPYSLYMPVPTPALAGPEPKTIVFGTRDAAQNWLHDDLVPASNMRMMEQRTTERLKYHTTNINTLKLLCHNITTDQNVNVRAEFHPVTKEDRRRSPGMAVWLNGDAEQVFQVRSLILKTYPFKLKCATVDIDYEQLFAEDGPRADIKNAVATLLQEIADYCAVDIFVTMDSSKGTSPTGSETSRDDGPKICIYGDLESVDFAKIRVLVMIDDILGLAVESMFVEVSLQSIICGRNRRAIQHIEAITHTNIYLPTAFPGVLAYKPESAQKRHLELILVTGDKDKIHMAIQMIKTEVARIKPFMKEVSLDFHKIDYILLERLDSIKKIMEENGTFVQFPILGTAKSTMRIQSTDVLALERTAKAVLTHATQYYNGTCMVAVNDTHNRPIVPGHDFRAIVDICNASKAEIGFRKSSFEVNGSDNAVKKALKLITDLPIYNAVRYQVKVKIEIGSEHKEFVAGKKNGKINKIMGQVDIQVLFEGFNEYDFYIDVVGPNYNVTKKGLELVELELPAQISFYVPDRYHKRIIGIGGQHIQRIMKKYSIFVKFSNAMDRDSTGMRDSEENVTDNVVCKTPARNAANLELVKAEINDMVEQADADYVEENVVIPRLYHRVLMAQTDNLHAIERKWSCKIRFPSSETASDIVTVSGPEWQVPQAIHQLNGYVPETFTLDIVPTDRVIEVMQRPEFQRDVVHYLSQSLNLSVEVLPRNKRNSHDNKDIQIQLMYTRDNQPDRDAAVEYIKGYFIKHGVTPELRGPASRPQKTDSFRNSLQFFPAMLCVDDLSTLSNGLAGTTLDHDVPRSGASSNRNSMIMTGEPQRAWNSWENTRRQSVGLSTRQQEQIIDSVLPEYLRQSGTAMSGMPGDRRSVLFDSTPDLDPTPTPFSMAVGTAPNPRASMNSNTFATTVQKRLSAETASRPSTGSSASISNPGAIGDQWSNAGKALPVPTNLGWQAVANQRKSWGHFPQSNGPSTYTYNNNN